MVLKLSIIRWLFTDVAKNAGKNDWDICRKKTCWMKYLRNPDTEWVNKNKAWYRIVPAGVTQFQFLHPFCRNGYSFVWTFNEHVSVDLEGCQYPDLKFSITLFSGQFLLRDTCAIEHHVLSFVVSVNRLSDIAIPVHIGFALYLGRQMSFDQQMNRSCSFLFNTMVSWLKNRNGRQVLSWCTGYAVLPHQFFLSGSMQQNPVAEDQVFVVRYISKEWYFLCRRPAIVVDVWGCRQLSVLEWQFSLHIPAWYDHYLVVFIWMEQSSVFCMCGAITCLT